MKRCPTCNQTFDDDALSYCLNDGTGLVSHTSSPPTDELQATMMATPSSLGGASYPPPPPSGPASGSFNPPPQNQSWTPPSSPTAPPPSSKSGGMNKKLIYGGIGCLGLGAVVVVIGIVLLVAFSGPSSKMNPYKADLTDLAPATVGEYKRSDIDPLRDGDKKYLGRVTNGIGVEYKGSSTDSDINMLVCNYATSKDAEEGLKSFTDEGVNNGWTRSEKGSKKIGWRTVGVRYTMTKFFSTGRIDDKQFKDGATLVRVQASSQTKSSTRQFIAWTNGSILCVVGGIDTKAVEFEKALDKEAK